MFSVELFLGFPVNEQLSQALESIDSKVAAFFLHGQDENFLKKVTYNHTTYLGKSAGAVSDITSIALLESNIYSILRKTVPSFHFEETQLILFPISANS